jgi:hypothetical protein
MRHFNIKSSYTTTIFVIFDINHSDSISKLLIYLPILMAYFVLLLNREDGQKLKKRRSIMAEQQQHSFATPGPAALGAFAVAVFGFGAVFLGKVGVNGLPLLAVWLIGGGIVQLTAGIMELKDHNVTGENGFLYFAGFFMFASFIKIISFSETCVARIRCTNLLACSSHASDCPYHKPRY